MLVAYCQHRSHFGPSARAISTSSSDPSEFDLGYDEDVLELGARGDQAVILLGHGQRHFCIKGMADDLFHPLLLDLLIHSLPYSPDTSHSLFQLRVDPLRFASGKGVRSTDSS